MASLPPLPHRNYVVYTCRSMSGVADDVIAHAARVAPEQVMARREIRWEIFPNRMPNLFIEDIVNARRRHVLFFGAFVDLAEMALQLDVLYVLCRSSIASLTVVLPFWPVGTMESILQRVDREGVIATSDTWAWRLNSLPLTKGGPTRFVIFDCHALSERFFFRDGALPYFVSATPLLAKKLNDLEAEDGALPIALAFPDAGAAKRFGKSFDAKYPVIVCNKVREGNTRVVKVQEGDPRGHHVVLVDDMVRSGGTLIECLKGMGAEHASAFCTHADFQSVGEEDKFIGDDAEVKLRKFWLTDSCPHITNRLTGRAPFEILSLASSIHESL